MRFDLLGLEEPVRREVLAVAASRRFARGVKNRSDMTWAQDEEIQTGAVAPLLEPGEPHMVTDRTIEVAKGLYIQGRTAEAEILYRELLSKQPDALGALEGLGVLCFQQGRVKEAAALFARARRSIRSRLAFTATWAKR